MLAYLEVKECRGRANAMCKNRYTWSIPNDSRLRSATRLTGEVRFDEGMRAAYAADASNYRQVPIGVVLPRNVEDIVAAVRVCRAHGAPMLAARRRHLAQRPDASTSRW